MKQIAAIVLFFFFVVGAHAQTGYDTVSHRPVGPGMWHTHIVNQSVPWNIHVFTADLKNPFLSIQTAKANDRLNAFERTSSMAKRKSQAGHTVIGAVNADFYNTGTGEPINIQVSVGEILRNPAYPRSTFGFDANNVPFLSAVTFNGTLSTRGASRAINSVNASRGPDQLILYNSYKVTTGTNQYGTEVLIHPLATWLANDTLKCVVDTMVQGVGNMSVPAGKAVLSGHGSSESFLQSNLQKGDTVTIFLGLNLAPAKVKEQVGGSPRLVMNGRNYFQEAYAQEGGASPFTREPRTGAGFSADSSKLILITVDGRQGNLSVGMTLNELADFMVQVGVGHGINLDGGGSTTMVVRDVIMNSPSDGGERSVSNSLLVFSSAPTDTLNTVLINPSSARVFRGDSIRFTLGGYDKYFNPVQIDSTRIQYSVESRLGTISPTGWFTSTMHPDTGYVYVQYNSMRDSARVIIKDLGRITMGPESVVTDTTKSVLFRVEAYDIDNIKRALPASSFQWTLTNPVVGTIDQTGTFKGKKAGSTKVIVSYGLLADTASVTVELAAGSSLLDSIETTAAWNMTGENIDLAGTKLTATEETKTLGTKSFRIDYTFTYNPSKLSYVYLDTDVPVFGVPDSIIIDARSDSASHRIFYIVEDDNKEQFRIYPNKFANRVGAFDTIRSALSTPVPITTGAEFHYPIRIKRIEILLGSSRLSGTVYKGTLFLDNLRVKYPGTVTSVEENVENVPANFRLFQNYPNPFNNATVVKFAVEKPQRVDLRLYDVLGRECLTVFLGEVLAGEHTVMLIGERLASGVYYVKSASSPVQTIKIVLVK